MFVGDPPMYFSKDPISSKRPPTCDPYKSTEERPMVIKSSVVIVRNLFV
jgi:hypothetical protein